MYNLYNNVIKHVILHISKNEKACRIEARTLLLSGNEFIRQWVMYANARWDLTVYGSIPDILCNKPNAFSQQRAAETFRFW